MTASADGRVPEWSRATIPLVSVAGGLLLLMAWFAPGWLVPAAVVAWGAALALPRVRAACTWRGVLACAGVLAIFWIKDRLMPGPLAAMGATAGFDARQPQTAALVAQLASLGTCLLLLPALRAAMEGPRVLKAWIRVTVLVLAGLAAAVLTHPAATADYGRGAQLGEVANRNAAAGAFALGAVLAVCLAIEALRHGRSREWPLAAAGAVLCAAAVAALGSRGAVFALAAGAAWLVVRLGGRRARLTLVALIVLVIAVLLAAPATLARLADLGSEFRLELWAGSARALAQAPWGGLGSGGFEAGFALLGGVVPVENMRVAHPDSSWVLLFSEWGLAGVAVVAVVLAYLLRGADDSSERTGLRDGVVAGLVVWAVAAAGDISLHRPVLLVVGLPLLAAAYPLAFRQRSSRGGRWVMAGGITVAVILAAASVWAVRLDARAADPGLIDAKLARLLPLDTRVNHVLGRAALARGESAEAARYFTVVAGVDPANAAAFEGYARALMESRPDLALSFWRRWLDVTGPRAPKLLTDELESPGGADAVYWMRAAESRPELWVVPADTDRAGAQRCYERWLTLPGPVRARSRVVPALGAMARWGATADLRAWMEAGPAVHGSEIAPAGRLLRARGRADLAWVWLDSRFPAPTLVKAETDAGLKARVLANPDDTVAAARLLDQMPPGEESLRLLERLVAKPGAPAAFRIRLARVLRESGRREEALDILLAAADAQAAAGR